MEGLSEYYRQVYDKFRNKNPQKEEGLADGIKSMINCFGELIFASEISSGKENVVKALVNTRVNIMHVKRKQRKPFLIGEEAALYLIKLDYLYRWAILEYIGVPIDTFYERVKARVAELDKWNGILLHFLNRI